jgi:hypothetical protein
VCRGYVEAQQDYALTKHDGSTVNQYAQRIISTPGKRDGLAWKTATGEWEGSSGRTTPIDQGRGSAAGAGSRLDAVRA